VLERRRRVLEAETTETCLLHAAAETLICRLVGRPFVDAVCKIVYAGQVDQHLELKVRFVAQTARNRKQISRRDGQADFTESDRAV
jgi:hypothetical protein